MRTVNVVLHHDDTDESSFPIPIESTRWKAVLIHWRKAEMQVVLSLDTNTLHALVTVSE